MYWAAEKFADRYCVLNSSRCGHRQNGVTHESCSLREVAAEERGANVMTLAELFMLLLALTVFVIVPMIFIQQGSRRKPLAQAALQECPNCGAQNRRGTQRCYCCGSGLIPLPSRETDPAVIQQVRQAD